MQSLNNHNAKEARIVACHFVVGKVDRLGEWR